MQKYEFLIKNKAGAVLASLAKITGCSFSQYLNKPGDASFSGSVYNEKLFGENVMPGFAELYIYRYGTLVWGGEIGSLQESMSDTQDGVTVTAKGFLDLLSKKVVGTAAAPRVFSSTDLSTIGWTLIDEAQTGTNASFGITQGVLATSRNADRSYDYKILKEALEGLSNLNIINGIDLEITAAKEFNTYYPQKGREIADVVFEWGKNIKSYTGALDSVDMTNRIILLGSGEGEAMVTTTRNNAALQAIYKIREKTLSYKDIGSTATLADHGDKELSLRGMQQQTFSLIIAGDCEPAYGSYLLGDSVKVVIQEGRVNINGFYRIYGIKVTVDDEDKEDIELTFINPAQDYLSQVVDSEQRLSALERA